jgi:hypothetical protein
MRQASATSATKLSIPLFVPKQKIVRMAGGKKYYAAAVLAIWLIIVTFFMVLNRTLDLEVYFVLSLIGLLVVAVLIDGAFSRPRYMRYLGYVIAAGVALFAYIVVEKILEIIAA